jgi:pimeloyl-ACP methyl ester carboxylesterase
VRIAYASLGEGPPLVKAANWLNHLELDFTSSVWGHWLEALSRDYRLLRYDERANGLSDWNVYDISLDAFVRDLETVVDAAGLERFPLLGVSQGCAISIAYTAKHPERVSHLVLYGGYAKGWMQDPANVPRGEALATLIRDGWDRDTSAFRQIFTSLLIPGASAEQTRSFNDLQRSTTSPENAYRLYKVLSQLDVRHLLKDLTGPTLILHAREDAIIKFAEGQELAANIPGARFVPLESQNHLLLQSEPAWEVFISEVRAFLGSGPVVTGLRGTAPMQRQLVM